MKIKCTQCEKEFQSSKEQSKLIELIRSKGGSLAMVECPSCYHTFGVDLGTQLEKHDPPYRCPLSGCTGLISHVKLKREKPFFGCGECGSTWHKKENLFSDISEIVEKYPYRLRSYKKDGTGWLAGDPDKEVKNYEEKVEKEPMDEGDSFDRD